MLTRNDFEVIAESLADVRPTAHGISVDDPKAQQWAKDVMAVADALKKINPRFDTMLFCKATQK
jgi:hypothetical protein